MSEEIVLDMAWELFQNLKDMDFSRPDESRHSGLVRAVYYFVKHHNFDIESLPDNIYSEIIFMKERDWENENE